MAGAQTGILELPYKASAALAKMKFVKVTGDQTVAQCDAQGELALGVAKVDVSAAEVTAGKAVAVQVHGVAWVVVGASITRFTEVTTQADGDAEPATTGDRVLGIALKGSTTVGDWIPVLLTPAGRVV